MKSSSIYTKLVFKYNNKKARSLIKKISAPLEGEGGVYSVPCLECSDKYYGDLGYLGLSMMWLISPDKHESLFVMSQVVAEEIYNTFSARKFIPGWKAAKVFEFHRQIIFPEFRFICGNLMTKIDEFLKILGWNFDSR